MWQLEQSSAAHELQVIAFRNARSRISRYGNAITCSSCRNAAPKTLKVVQYYIISYSTVRLRYP
jgi:hypothetical protein